MIYSKLINIIKTLPFDTKVKIYSESDSEIYILRPSVLSRRFTDYDINKNFQIWLREGEREFRPNHLRVMLDLNLRIRCRIDLKHQLLLAFDNIFYGKDPIEELKILNTEVFDHNLNSLLIIGTLSQLFIAEQDYCYPSNRESKYEPPTLFYQGWVRQFLDGPKEIDNLAMSVCNRQPPASKYTNKEDKKSRKYESSLADLWYLNKH